MTDKQKITFKALNTPLKSKQVKAVMDEFYPVSWKKSHVIVTLAVAGLLSGWAASTYLTSDVYILIAIVFGFIILFAIVTQTAWMGEIQLRTRLANRHIRLRNFAKENNFEYIERTVEPRSTSVVFTPGTYATAYDQFRSTGPNPFEVGIWRDGLRDPNDDHRNMPGGCGYIHMKLERRVPHLILSGGFDVLTKTDVTLSFKQILGLEGDFYKSFSLFVPADYERDALYILTPDFMALLVDQAKYAEDMMYAHLSVEVVEDDLFIYSEEFDFLDEQTWKMIIGLVSAIGAKTISRTDLYYDEKVGLGRAANVIAKRGQRLQQVFSWFPFWYHVCIFLFCAGLTWLSVYLRDLNV